MSIRFLLIDGQIVIGERDCTCTDHDGPHWLYANDIWRESNEKLLAAGNVRGFIVVDLARVKEKRWEMEHQRIKEILR